MFKTILEVASLVVAFIGLFGVFGAPTAVVNKKWTFGGVALIALLSLLASRQVVPGHELLTLVGVTVLLLADFVWFANTYAATHGSSLFGWLQAHKADADKKADLDAATQAAKNAVKQDAPVAQANATQAVGQAASAAGGALADAVKSGVAQAVQGAQK
jgi:hypothetical protein